MSESRTAGHNFIRSEWFYSGLKLFVVFGVIPSHFRYLSNDTSIQRDSALNFPFPFPENIPYVLLKADADIECAHTCLHFIKLALHN